MERGPRNTRKTRHNGASGSLGGRSAPSLSLFSLFFRWLPVEMVAAFFLVFVFVSSVPPDSPENLPSPELLYFSTTVDIANKVIHDEPVGEKEQETAAVFFEKFQGSLREVLGTARVFLFAGLGFEGNFVPLRIRAGYRKEEIARDLTRALSWSTKQKNEFIALVEEDGREGRFSPGVYTFSRDASPRDILHGLESRFSEKILARYPPSLEETVPLSDALTIASLVERESGGDRNDMALISGIFWNRLFSDMRLESDVTLQYAKGNSARGWWPAVSSRDKFIRSPYNTYRQEGLPPTPIASPSVAAVEAALQPEKTNCLFFLHDRRGGLHCSVTYSEHLSNIKKYY